MITDVFCVLKHYRKNEGYTSQTAVLDEGKEFKKETHLHSVAFSCGAAVIVHKMSVCSVARTGVSSAVCSALG